MSEAMTSPRYAGCLSHVRRKNRLQNAGSAGLSHAATNILVRSQKSCYSTRMIRPLRATFLFNDLEKCVEKLPIRPKYRRGIDRAVARLNSGRGGRVELRLLMSKLQPGTVRDFGVDTEITL